MIMFSIRTFVLILSSLSLNAFAVTPEQFNEWKKQNRSYDVGNCYAIGDGVDKDLTEATNWWYKAVIGSSNLAAKKLGFAYYYGEGVAKNKTEAYAFFLFAANIEKDFRIVRVLDRDLTPSECMAGERRCDELFSICRMKLNGSP